MGFFLCITYGWDFMIDDLSGKQLDAYQLIRRLSSGTFGDVYETSDMRRNERATVKVMEHSKRSRTS
jgi:serine/threonine protein kinase